MIYPRPLLLFDPTSGHSWDEQMVPGEYAVHYSSFEGAGAPYCTVFGDLNSAEEYAHRQIAERPTLRCRIYDHQGSIGAPMREVRGGMYKGESELTPRFRRWAGSILFFGGLILFVFDWSRDFSLSWPSLIGTRMVIPGLVLLCCEVAIVLYAKAHRGRATGRGTA